MDTYITEIKELKDKGTITDRLIREMLDAEKKEIEELGKTNPELAIEMEGGLAEECTDAQQHNGYEARDFYGDRQKHPLLIFRSMDISPSCLLK